MILNDDNTPSNKVTVEIWFSDKNTINKFD